MNDRDWGAEERRVLEIMDRLAGSDAADLDRRLADEGDREIVEAICRLPLALEPGPAVPAVREAVVARARGEPRAAAVAERRGPARRQGWLLPLAAVLALTLAAISGWQYLRLERQGQALWRLDQRLASAEGVEHELTALRAELAGYRARLEMLTTPGAEFCVLKPSGREPVNPRAHATMVLAADRKSWYLRADGLEPCARDRAYKIWFHTEGDPVPGPAFRVDESGEPVEVTDGAAPEGIRGVSITLESQPAVLRPEGPEILYADEAMRLL